MGINQILETCFFLFPVHHIVIGWTSFHSFFVMHKLYPEQISALRVNNFSKFPEI